MSCRRSSAAPRTANWSLGLPRGWCAPWGAFRSVAWGPGSQMSPPKNPTPTHPPLAIQALLLIACLYALVLSFGAALLREPTLGHWGNRPAASQPRQEQHVWHHCAQALSQGSTVRA